jgi:uncharacterized membrane protein YkoI
MKNNYANKKSRKKEILFGVLVSSIVISGIFLINSVNSMVEASLNQNANSTIEINKARDSIPKLNGSVNVFEKSHEAIKNSMNVSFADAAYIAEDQFSDDKNITILEGELNVKQGSLVYGFTGIDHDAKKEYYVYVDPGNGSVLYISEGKPTSKLIDHGYFGDPDRFQKFYGGHDQGHEWNGFGLGSWFNKLTGSTGHNNTVGNHG